MSITGDDVYVTAGSAPDDKTYNNVYCYKTNTDHWTELPQPGHRYGVLHMLDDRLTIFGGSDPATHRRHNKVTTYNKDTNSWYSLYPDMLNNRFKPGVITHHNYVIVMGGKYSRQGNSRNDIHNSIEVMEYRGLRQWKEILISLPAPMWNIKPTMCGDNIIIVGYVSDLTYTNFYQLPVEKLISSLHQPLFTYAVSIKWKTMLHATHYNTVTIPYSNPPMIIGGQSHDDDGSIRTSDVSLYDASKNLWRKVESLTTARSNVGVDLLNNNTIVVIGGTSSGTGVEEAIKSSLTVVEIGNIVPNH